MVVAGAMLYSGSVAGLRIPKSPSFHSGLDLAAEKDFKFVTSHSTGSFTDMPSLQQSQQQDQTSNNTNHKTSQSNTSKNTTSLAAASVGGNGGNGTNNGNISPATATSIATNSYINGESVVTVTTITKSSIQQLTGSPGRARDRNVFNSPPSNAAVALPLLRGV